MNCLLCGDLSAAGEVVFDDGRCAVLLHPDRAVRGHAMIVWRAHVENLSDLGADDLAHLMRVHTNAERALLEMTGSRRAILLKLGVQVPHLHVHIYPVTAEHDRAAIMAAINAETNEEREPEFAEQLRRRLAFTLPARAGTSRETP